MGTKIEWAQETWNVITGCSPVSEGCENCYAARMSKRLAGRCGYPSNNSFAVTHHLEKLDLPRRWRKPRRVFVNSMGDLFHPDVPETTLRAIFYEMSAWNLQHTFMILTKRPERMKAQIDKWIADGVIFRDGVKGRLTNNIWLGVTAENQRTADERIPILLQIPAAVRFVSCEPLLGPIDLTDLHYQNTIGINALKGSCGVWEPHTSQEAPGLGWIVTGGETGPKARYCDPEWIKKLWKQCRVNNVPFFWKQWGSNRPEKMPVLVDYVSIQNTRQFPEVKR